MLVPVEGDHLCVFVHGLWGTPDHLKQLVSGLRDKYESESFHILVPHTNSQYLTYDGLDIGGERVAKETEDELARLEKEGRKVTKISFVGYSLGGIFARYCIGLLYSRGWFDKITPVNFTAFASPFLGVRAPYRGYHSSVWNALGGHTLSASGAQIFLLDKFRDTGRPLLSVLTDPNSIFIKALSMFKNRVLYANCINDRSAPYFTTMIDSTDPYEDLSIVDLHPLDGYNGTILSPTDPVTPKPTENLSALTRFTSSASAVVSNLPFIALVSVLAPIGVVGFLANSGYQTIQSTKRMKLHAEDSTLGFAAYRTGLLLENSAPAQKLDIDEANEIKNGILTNGATKEQLSAAKDVETNSNSKATKASKFKSTRSSSSSSSSRTASLSEKSLEDDLKKDKPFPTLALAPEQFEMIKNLNAVGWRKYPVHIRKVRHSHAAIIVRMDMERYYEGKEVIRHWVEEEFEV